MSVVHQRTKTHLSHIIDAHMLRLWSSGLNEDGNMSVMGPMGFEEADHAPPPS